MGLRHLLWCMPTPIANNTSKKQLVQWLDQPSLVDLVQQRVRTNFRWRFIHLVFEPLDHIINIHFSHMLGCEHKGIVIVINDMN